jgi:hypothetical protein
VKVVVQERGMGELRVMEVVVAKGDMGEVEGWLSSSHLIFE